MRIYISLPISGRPSQESRNQADNVKTYISKLGHTPVSPFDIYAGKNPTYADHITCDLRAMMDCDAVVFLPGWQFSTGCCIERQVATLMLENPSTFGREFFRIYERPGFIPRLDIKKTDLDPNAF